MLLTRAIRIAGAALLGLMVLCGGIGIGAAWTQSNALERQVDSSALLANHELADMMHDAVRSDVLGALEASNLHSGLKREDILKDFADHLKDLRAGIAADARYRGSAEVEAATSKLAAPMERYAQSATSIMARMGDDPAGARRDLPAFFAQFRLLETSMAAASDAISANAAKTSASAKSIGTVAMVVLLIAMAAGVAGTLAFVRIAIRHVIGPIAVHAGTMRELGAGNLAAEVIGADRHDELGDMAKAMLAFRDQLQAADASKHAQAQLIVDSLGTGLIALARGDLTANVAASLEPPFTALKDNFNSAVGNLHAMIVTVAGNTETISAGSREIAQASEDLARRTESNAASLEQTSAALTQMEARIKASAVASQSTVARADEAMATVDKGRTTAETAKQAMGRVSGSAKGIDDVIEGLDKIAFQTRVLAMNAAVEAGRAGDAGRGFAVVADLVSALAMRAEEEAKRARDQLSVTQSEIVTAVEAVGRVDTALAAISTDVDAVNTLLAGMASDNQAQSSVIVEITAAVASMDRATQQNAAMVEQTSAAARSLAHEVAALASATAQFTIDGDAAPPTPVARQTIPARPTPRTPPVPRLRGPKAKAVANGHAAGDANGKAASSDWSTF